MKHPNCRKSWRLPLTFSRLPAPTSCAASAPPKTAVAGRRGLVAADGKGAGKKMHLLSVSVCVAFVHSLGCVSSSTPPGRVQAPACVGGHDAPIHFNCCILLPSGTCLTRNVLRSSVVQGLHNLLLCPVLCIPKTTNSQRSKSGTRELSAKRLHKCKHTYMHTYIHTPNYIHT